jgi:hypothetical protein
MDVTVTKERWISLQRTVDTLEARLQNVQWEIRQAKGLTISERLRRNLLGPWQSNGFMSACCNRRIRPNTKVVNHVGATIGR